MKKLLVILMLLLLAACEPEETFEYEYSDLDSEQVTSYMEGETMDGKYILYYYSETCPGCNDVKQDIIPFFMEFSLLDVYLLNTAEMFDISLFTEFVGTPSLFIIDGSKNLYETYIGVQRVRTFMETYEDINLTLNMFDQQKVNTFEAYEQKESTMYTLLYSEDIEMSQLLLKELFRLSSVSLTLINVDEAETDLIALFDYDTVPTLVVNDETNEYIQGEQYIINYLED